MFVRQEHLSFTNKLIEKLSDKGITTPLVEHDDDSETKVDNVFINLRDTDYISGRYLQIDIESQDSYSISLRERGHSGGDPTLGESVFFDIKNEDAFIQEAVEIYESALNN